MKKLSVFIAITLFSASVSVFAQNKPKSSPKGNAKKECKMGESCCSGKTEKAVSKKEKSTKKV